MSAPARRLGVEAAFARCDTGGYATALGAMARHGVTAALPTFPTLSPEAYLPAMHTLTAVMADPPPGTRGLGAHLEGPFLNPERRGAHRQRWLRPVDLSWFEGMLRAGPISIVTIAPEIAGAMELIAAARRARVVVSFGHSDAGAGLAHGGFDAGASMVTHLWNAQRPPSARDAAVAGAALTRDDVFVGLIADLVHVSADMVRLTLRAAPGRTFVVTDALAVAGLDPDEGLLPPFDEGRSLVVDGGAARLSDGTLAGATTPLDAALRNLIGLGVPLLEALACVSTVPAAALHATNAYRPGLGELRPGGPADVAVLDDRVELRDVLVGGRSAF